MYLEVITPTGNLYSQATTDSAYQARNFILRHDPVILDAYTARSPRGLLIKSSADLNYILSSQPSIQSERPFTPHKPPTPERHEQSPSNPDNVTLRQLLKSLPLQPAHARRILRKHFGAKNVRYEWSKQETASILKILKAGAR